MKKILVILEPPQEQNLAIERAIAIGKQLDAQLHVLICCYQELSWFTNVFGMLENKQAKAHLLEQKEQWWQEYAEQYRQQISMTHEVVWCKYFVETILSHCNEQEYDFIVKKGHRSETLLYTPSDYLLLRDSKIPVYIAVAKQFDSKQPIIVALDLLARSDEKQRLNDKLLAVSTQLAAQTGRELICCFAVSIPTLLNDLEIIDMEQHCRKLETLARDKAQQLLSRYQISDEKLHVARGAPWKAIINLSSKLDASLIVVGNVGNKGVKGKFIGNSCENMLHISRKDLLVVGLDN